MLALETEDRTDLEKGQTQSKLDQTPDLANKNSRYRNDPEIYQMEQDLSMHKVSHKNR